MTGRSYATRVADVAVSALSAACAGIAIGAYARILMQVVPPMTASVLPYVT